LLWTAPYRILPAAAGKGGKSMAELDARLVQHRLKAERQARALRTQAIMLHRRLATLTQPAAHVALVAVSANRQRSRKGLAASLVAASLEGTEG